jgi:hypothetical protein
MAASSLTRKELERIREMTAQGHTTRTIAAELGRARSVIGRAVVRLRESPLPPDEEGDVVITPEQQDQIEDLIERGWHTPDIIRETGCSLAQVRAARDERNSRRAGERAARAQERKLGLQPAPTSSPRPRAAYDSVPDEDIDMEDYAWATGRKVPSVRDLRIMREARAAA